MRSPTVTLRRRLSGRCGTVALLCCAVAIGGCGRSGGARQELDPCAIALGLPEGPADDREWRELRDRLRRADPAADETLALAERLHVRLIAGAQVFQGEALSEGAEREGAREARTFLAAWVHGLEAPLVMGRFGFLWREELAMRLSLLAKRQGEDALARRWLNRAGGEEQGSEELRRCLRTLGR